MLIISWSSENKSCRRVDKPEFVYEGFLNCYVLVKPQQELQESQ